MTRRLCARLSFVLSVVSLALFAHAPGAAASGTGECDGDHVVVLDTRVNSQVDSSDPQSVSGSFATSVPAGIYDIRVVTVDAYEGRESVTQLNEQVVVSIGDVTFGPTPDLADGQASATVTARGQIELGTAVDGVVVSHVLSDSDKHQSVGIACVALDIVSAPPPPPPPPSTPPTCVGDHVVTIGKLLDSRAGVSTPNSRSASFAGTVPAGSYDVQVGTFDAYEGRESVSQPNEQVVVAFGDVTFVPTPDLADRRPAAAATATGRIELAAPVDGVVISHLLSGPAKNNSVAISCISLTAVADPPPPPADEVDVTVGHTCAPTPGIVVDVVNPGGPTTGTITVDGVPTAIEIGAEVPTTVVIPAEPGVRRVVVEVAGVVVADEDHEVLCSTDPGEGIDDPPGGDEEPGAGDGDDDPPGGEEPGAGDGDEEPGAGEEPGDTPGSGDDTPGTPGTPPGTPPAEISPLGFLPELTVRVACADRTIEASVGNVGDTLGSVTLAVAPSARSVLAEVAPASSTTVSLPLPSDAEGTRTEVVVVTESGEVLTGFADVDCLAPAVPLAEVVVDCAAGTVAVLVENAGGEAIAVRAFAEQVALLGSARLEAGEQVRYEIELTGPTVPLRVVAADGSDILRDEIEHGCRQDDVTASLSVVCPGDTLELALTNGSDEPRRILVESGGTGEAVDLAAGAEVVLVRSLAETDAVVVTSAFGDVLLEESLDGWGCDPATDTAPCGPAVATGARWVVAADAETIPCPGLDSRLIVDCATGVGVVEISNGSGEVVVVSVRRDGELVDDVAASPGEIVSLSIPGVSGTRVSAEAAGERLLDTRADCRGESSRTAAVLSGLLVALMSIVAVVVARFDPWIRV